MEKIYLQLKDMETMMEVKELERPSVNLRLNWCAYMVYVEVEYYDGTNYVTERFRRHDVDHLASDLPTVVDEVLQEASDYIDGIKSKEERQHDEFMAQMGRLIDKGRDIGIDVDFLNPLTEMMRKLSENVLEDKRSK